jgi:diguanylate cyclase (GGDEF)-like protein
MTSPRHPSLSLYIKLVAFAAVVGVGFDVWSSVRSPVFGPHPAEFAFFAACCLVTELRPLRWLRLQDGGEVTASWTFMLALLLVAPPAAPVAVSVIVFVTGDLVSRKSPPKVLFNASQITIALTLAYVVLWAGHQQDVLVRAGSPTLWWFVAFAVAAALAFAVNSLLTCIAIAIHQDCSISRTIQEGAIVHLSTDGMLIALSPVFVVVGERSLRLVPLLLVTTWVVYHSAASALARRHEADHDPLTQLPNRRVFDSTLAAAIEKVERSGQSVGVVVLDLDRFKTVNDGLGHQVGDQVLLDVAARLRAACRPSDLVVRLGGDEFAIIVTPASSVEAVETQARRCLAAFADEITGAGFPVSVSASVGVAVLPDHAADAETLVRHADEAMYRAKQGRLGVVVYDNEFEPVSIGRIGLLTDLSRAVQNNELFLVYQPQISLVTNQIVGVEALLRWQHPRVGIVGPSSFMPLAEHTEMIRPITDWVLGEALAQCARWQHRGFSLRMSINASAYDIKEKQFVTTVGRRLQETGVSASCLELEITENALTGGTSAVYSVLAALRSLGVAISIDDFGTGYSSMTQLRDLPVDQIKVDRQFVSRMTTDSRDAVIVESIIRLGTSLGLETVAEGVQDSETATRLQQLGCEMAQGFYYARPVAADRIEDLIVRGKRSLSVPNAPQGVGA